MSHTLEAKTKFADHGVVVAACERLKLAKPVVGQHKFYDGKVHRGMLVQLPEWRHPIVINNEGVALMDNYGGQWGKDIELHKFEAAYGVEAALQAVAEQPTWAVQELMQVDNVTYMTISVGD